MTTLAPPCGCCPRTQPSRSCNRSRSGAVNQSCSRGQRCVNSSNTANRLDRTLLDGTFRQTQAR